VGLVKGWVAALTCLLLATSALAGGSAARGAVAVLRVSCTLGSAAQSSPSIELLGVAWDRTSLSVYVVKPPWLSDEYAEQAARAFEVWDRALEAFGRSYGFEHLAQFSFSVRVVESAPPAYDVLVEFTEDVAEPGSELGEAILTYSLPDRRILRVNIVLHVYSTLGQLSPLDVFNVALHEVGHALGLGHASASETQSGPELMRPEYTLGMGELRPSTLDAYGVAVAHGWMEGGEFKAPPETSVVLPEGVPYVSLLCHYVSVLSEYGAVRGGGWYVEGATARISVESEVVYLSDRTRARFAGWSGDVASNETELVIVVNENVTVVAEWVVQHYVEVETAYSSANVTSGWYDEGTRLRARVLETVVDHGNGTRRVFRGWAGDVNIAAPVVKLVVTRPLVVRALWATRHWVEILPGPFAANATSGWYDEGAEVVVAVPSRVIDFGNGTRALFMGWNSTGELAYRLRVTGPVRLVASWVRQYWVEVRTPYSAMTAGSGWRSEGAELSISLVSCVVDHGNDTRRVFRGWLVNGELVRSATLKLSVDSPLKVEATWETQYRVRISIATPSGIKVLGNVTLARGRRELVVRCESRTPVWLSEGAWEVREVRYLRPEAACRSLWALSSGLVTTSAEPAQPELRVERPGELTVLVAAHKLSVVVRDYLGLPAPWLTVEVLGRVNVTALSCPTGLAVKTVLPRGRYVVRASLLGFELCRSEVELNADRDEVLRVPISAYELIITAAAVAALLAVRLRRGGAPHGREEG